MFTGVLSFCSGGGTHPLGYGTSGGGGGDSPARHGTSGGGKVLTPTPRQGIAGRGGTHPPPGHRIQWDRVDRRTVRILLKCFLVTIVIYG